jgi:hypothetical protein
MTSSSVSIFGIGTGIHLQSQKESTFGNQSLLHSEVEEDRKDSRRAEVKTAQL